MSLRIDDRAPDFTPICTTELGTVAALEGQSAARGCELIGIGVDGVQDHQQPSDN